MLSAYVPNLYTTASRFIDGVLILPTDHPVALCAMIADLAGASAAVLLDAVAGRP